MTCWFTQTPAKAVIVEFALKELEKETSPKKNQCPQEEEKMERLFPNTYTSQVSLTQSTKIGER